MEDDDREPVITRRAAAYALAAILGGSGGSIIHDIMRDPRPDPYTGRDGLRDKVQLMERMRRILEKQERLKDSIHEMELEHNDLKNQLGNLRSMLLDQQRHLEHHKDSELH